MSLGLSNKDQAILLLEVIRNNSQPSHTKAEVP